MYENNDFIMMIDDTTLPYIVAIRNRDGIPRRNLQHYLSWRSSKITSEKKSYSKFRVLTEKTRDRKAHR